MDDVSIPSYDKIGGWLILVAIGLVGTMLIGVYSLGTSHFMLFLDGTIDKMLIAPPGSINSLIVPVFFFEIIGNLTIIVAAGFLLLQLLKRASRFPRNIIGFYLASFAFLALDSIVYFWIAPQETIVKSDIQDLVRAFVVCAVWIPYFLISQRVQGTFRAVKSDGQNQIGQGKTDGGAESTGTASRPD